MSRSLALLTLVSCLIVSCIEDSNGKGRHRIGSSDNSGISFHVGNNLPDSPPDQQTVGQARIEYFNPLPIVPPPSVDVQVWDEYNMIDDMADKLSPEETMLKAFEARRPAELTKAETVAVVGTVAVFLILGLILSQSMMSGRGGDDTLDNKGTPRLT